VILRGPQILAAGAVLPLAEMTIHTERLGTRHRAALGITEQSDALVVVVSEETRQISLVERARIVRNLNEAQLSRAIRTLLRPRERSGPLPGRVTAQLFRGGRLRIPGLTRRRVIQAPSPAPGPADARSTERTGPEAPPTAPNPPGKVDG
jgi:hypothetical protein